MMMIIIRIRVRQYRRLTGCNPCGGTRNGFIIIFALFPMTEKGEPCHYSFIRCVVVWMVVVIISRMVVVVFVRTTTAAGSSRMIMVQPIIHVTTVIKGMIVYDGG